MCSGELKRVVELGNKKGICGANEPAARARAEEKKKREGN